MTMYLFLHFEQIMQPQEEIRIPISYDPGA